MRFSLELDTDGLLGHLLFNGLVKSKSNPDHMQPQGQTGRGSEQMDMSLYQSERVCSINQN